MKVLTIDLHPNAGSQLVYNNVHEWTWDEKKVEVVLANETIVLLNPAYVIALVWQEVEDNHDTEH